MLSADRPPRFVVRGTTSSLTKQAMDTQEGRLRQGEGPPCADWGHDPDPVRNCATASSP
jgi:hypothetical protein